MTTSSHLFFTLLLAPPVVIYLITQFIIWYQNWWKLGHVAECIDREIRTNNENLEAFIEHFPSVEEKIINREGYRPFMFANHKSSDVVTALRDTMLRLPSKAVDFITEFYHFDHEVNVMIDRLQTDAFLALDKERKIETLGNFKTVLDSMNASGKDALFQLEMFITERKPGFLSNITKKMVTSVRIHSLSLASAWRSFLKNSNKL